MTKTKRGSKQSGVDSTRDEEEKRIRDLEQENKDFQVISRIFLILYVSLWSLFGQ